MIPGFRNDVLSVKDPNHDKNPDEDTTEMFLEITTANNIISFLVTCTSQVASMVEDVDFYIVSKPATMKEIGATEASIRVMKSFDEPIVDFKESLTKENLKR